MLRQINHHSQLEKRLLVKGKMKPLRVPKNSTTRFLGNET